MRALHPGAETRPWTPSVHRQRRVWTSGPVADGFSQPRRCRHERCRCRWVVTSRTRARYRIGSAA